MPLVIVFNWVNPAAYALNEVDYTLITYQEKLESLYCLLEMLILFLQIGVIEVM